MSISGRSPATSRELRRGMIPWIVACAMLVVAAVVALVRPRPQLMNLFTVVGGLSAVFAVFVAIAFAIAVAPARTADEREDPVVKELIEIRRRLEAISREYPGERTLLPSSSRAANPYLLTIALVFCIAGIVSIVRRRGATHRSSSLSLDWHGEEID